MSESSETVPSLANRPTLVADLSQLSWVPNSIAFDKIDPESVREAVETSRPLFDHIANELDLDGRLAETLAGRSENTPGAVEKTKLGMFLVLAGHLVSDDALGRTTEDRVTGEAKLKSLLEQMLGEIGRLPSEEEVTKWVTRLFLENCRGCQRRKKLVKGAKKEGDLERYQAQEMALREATKGTQNASTMALKVINEAPAVLQEEVEASTSLEPFLDHIFQLRYEIDPALPRAQRLEELRKYLKQIKWLKRGDRRKIIRAIEGEDFNDKRPNVEQVLHQAFYERQSFFNTKKALDSTFSEQGVSLLAKPLRLFGNRIRLKVLKTISKREFFRRNFFTEGYFGAFMPEREGMWQSLKQRVHGAVEFCIGGSGDRISSVDAWETMVADILKAGNSGVNNVDKDIVDRAVTRLVDRIQEDIAMVVEDQGETSEAQTLWAEGEAKGITAFFQKHAGVTPSAPLIKAIREAQKSSEVPFDLLLDDVLSPQERLAYEQLLQDVKASLSIGDLENPEGAANRYLLACRDQAADHELKAIIGEHEVMTAWNDDEVFLARVKQDIDPLVTSAEGNPTKAREVLHRLKEGVTARIQKLNKTLEASIASLETHIKAVEAAVEKAHTIAGNLDGKTGLETVLAKAKSDISQGEERLGMLRESIFQAQTDSQKKVRQAEVVLVILEAALREIDA